MSERPPKPEADATVRLNEDGDGGSRESRRGERLGEFEILGELGRGGMGVVYEAHQSSLDRRVALKVLPATIGMSSQATQRFEREARAAARLQHRNIVAVHAIGEDRGQHFYAMELVDGVSLDRVLGELSHGRWHDALDSTLTGERSGLDRSVVESQSQTGGRAWADTVSSLIAEVAEGLEYAHSQGVVHRDIKPANLMLSSQGNVLITDFGLARLAQEPGMTMSGALVGTPAYMSPEQVAAGRMPLDHRTDIYSLGAVLYEMLTLKRPFRGDSRDEVIGGVLTRDPTMPRRIKPAIPQDLETICLKALEKDPGRRYQTAGEMARDLREYLRGGMIAARPMNPLRRTLRVVRRHPTMAVMVASLAFIAVLVTINWDRLQRVTAPSGPQEIKRLAVLPFRNASGEPDQEFYADGMTEVLITELGQIEALEVIAQRSVLPYKDTPKPIQEIARELKVDAIVEGSVLRSEGRVRVTATLVDASTESQLWGGRYERSQQDILMLQGEVAQGIANQIRVELTPEEQALLTATRAVNPKAHEAYVIGKSFVDRWSREAVTKGIRYLQEAVEYDPDYARPYAGLATGYLYSASLGGGWRAPNEVVGKARAAVTRALELDSSLAEAHTALAGLSIFFDWDFETGERELQRAIQLNPSFTDARIVYAVLLHRLGGNRSAEALDQLKLAVETDPLNPWARVHLIFTYLGAGDSAKVYEEYSQLMDLHPEPVLQAQGVLALAFFNAAKGRVADAISMFERCVELTERKHPDMLTYLGLIYERVGRHADAVNILDELSALANERYVSPFLLARIYATMGDADKAFELLEQAYELHCGYMFYLASSFGTLRSDRRWDDLVKRVGLPA